MGKLFAPWKLRLCSYLKAFTAEQLQARVIVKQAVPLFLPKIHSLERFLTRKMNSPSISAQELYILPYQGSSVP